MARACRRSAKALVALVVALSVAAETTQRQLITFSHVATRRGSSSSDDAATFESEYVSSAILLDPGRVVLSDPDQTPLAMPEDATWWLRGIALEVIDGETNASVPLTEVYVHHVAIYDGSKGADLCGGADLDSKDSLWDVGAEARGTRTFFPAPYGYFVNRTGSQAAWSANVHLIRTSGGVPNVKRCIECACAAGGGSEACCPDGALCPGMDGYSSMAARGGPSPRGAQRAYRLRYVVRWDPHAEDGGAAAPGGGGGRTPAETKRKSPTETLLPLTYRTLDVASCQLEFNVPAVCPWSYRHAGTTAGSFAIDGLSLVGTGRSYPFDFLLDDAASLPAHCVATRSWTTTWAEDDGVLVFGKGHLHVGALNMTLARVERDGSETELCTVVPRYGRSLVSTGVVDDDDDPVGVPGDELGYVVGISNCDDAFAARPALRRGDVLRVTARYRAQPWYDGVMGLFDVAVGPPRAEPYR